jgi:hypothetical protein
VEFLDYQKPNKKSPSKNQGFIGGEQKKKNNISNI